MFVASIIIVSEHRLLPLHGNRPANPLPSHKGCWIFLCRPAASLLPPDCLAVFILGSKSFLSASLIWPLRPASACLVVPPAAVASPSAIVPVPATDDTTLALIEDCGSGHWGSKYLTFWLLTRICHLLTLSFAYRKYKKPNSPAMFYNLKTTCSNIPSINPPIIYPPPLRNTRLWSFFFSSQ